MKASDLSRQPYQYLGTVGVIRDPEGVPPLTVSGVNGGNDYCTGLQINDAFVERLPGEAWDDMVARVRRDPALRGDPCNIAVAIYPGVTPKRATHRRSGRWTR